MGLKGTLRPVGSLSLSFSLSLYVISVASGSTVVAFYFKMASQALNQSLLTCLL